MIERGTIIGGRYVFQEPIGRGGLSVIYRVEHVHTGETLAMKVLHQNIRLDPDAITRFKREIRTSSRIRSEHVVRVTDADTAPELDEAPFMVMELLRGSDLEREEPLSAESVLSILGQVASVLEEAHALGIIHRDLKPANLFLHERPDGTKIVKVLDFGISKFISKDAEPIAVTSTGAVLGTPLYMAPEQAHAKNDAIGPATDIWAIGLIALRLLVGEHYWGKPTMPELMAKITTAPLVPPSERWPDSPKMSPALDAWFLRSCERDPEKRWSSVREQVSALASALGQAPLSAPSKVRSRRPGLVVVLAIAAGGVALASLIRERHREHAVPSITNVSVDSTVIAAPSTPVTEASVESSPAASTPPVAASEIARLRPAPTPRASMPRAKPVESAIVCRETEVLSLGHCCPSGHVWQSGRCTRPIATSF